MLILPDIQNTGLSGIAIGNEHKLTAGLLRYRLEKSAVVGLRPKSYSIDFTQARFEKS